MISVLIQCCIILSLCQTKQSLVNDCYIIYFFCNTVTCIQKFDHYNMDYAYNIFWITWIKITKHSYLAIWYWISISIFIIQSIFHYWYITRTLIMFVCVYIYIYMYIYVYCVCIYIYIYIFIYIHTPTQTYIYMSVYIYSTSLQWAGRDKKSIFKQSTTGLNSVFFLLERLPYQG